MEEEEEEEENEEEKENEEEEEMEEEKEEKEEIYPRWGIPHRKNMLLTKQISIYSYHPQDKNESSSMKQDEFTWIQERKWSNFATVQKDTFILEIEKTLKKHKLR